MSKQATRLLNFFLAVLPIALILVAGCSSGEPQASGSRTTSNVSGNLESSGAEAGASGSASAPEEGTGAPQSAPPATGANATAQAAAAGEGTAQPAAASGPESAAAPAGTTPAATPSPAAGNAGSASKASPEADHADGSSPSAQGSAPSIAAAQPTATAKLPSTAKPAAAVQPAASVKPADNAATASTATISIVGDKEFGIILSATSVKVEEGDTVLDLLKRITRANKMQMEFSGAKGFSYIEGIDNLYEFDHGAESGWMYRVNGEFPSKSAGAYTVKPGDMIDWLYTLDMGKDIGAKGP